MADRYDNEESQQSRYLSDDDEGLEGTEESYLAAEEERLARRSELARQLDDFITDAADWLETTDDADAAEIHEALVAIYERLSAPPEDTDPETGGISAGDHAAA